MLFFYRFVLFFHRFMLFFYRFVLLLCYKMLHLAGACVGVLSGAAASWAPQLWDRLGEAALQSGALWARNEWCGAAGGTA